jgi:hypothetical protein
MGRKSIGCLDNSLLKYNTLFGEGINGWAGIAVIPIDTKVISSQGIERDKNDTMRRFGLAKRKPARIYTYEKYQK